MVVPHCARGPKLCNKCKAAESKPMFCLVQAYLEHGMKARPIDKFPIDGNEAFYEFDVIRRFKDEAEARTYAREHPEVHFLRKE